MRLVQEEERHWNREEQKWDVVEKAEQKGQLDSAGHVKFTIDLKEQYVGFTEDGYRRYRDFDYEAYLTDQTTGKTEQRRFEVRVSRDPIHVYVANTTMVGKVATFYVVTAYPDGSPASCSVDIADLIEKSRPEGPPPPRSFCVR